MESAGTSETSGAQSAHRLLDVLTEVALHAEGVTATDVARAVGLTTPTTHRLLKVLCGRGFAVHDQNAGRYRPGPQIRLLAGDGVDHVVLTEVARPLLLQLRDETGETVLMSVRNGMHLTYVEVVTSGHSVQMHGAPGMRVPLHATSQGKVIMAFAAPGLGERLVDQLDYSRFTPNTITKAEDLADVLAEVRETGYAVNLEEREAGVRSLAAPILDSSGTAVAAVCVGGPIFRISEADLRGHLADRVRQAAQEISRRLAERTTTGGFV